jgi:hypothetical protein
MHELSSRRFLKKAGASCLSFFLAAIGTAQQVIENPAKPTSINAGRVVSLKEVARITDGKGKFLFVQPFGVFTGRDGSVYVQEYNQFLKFDATGKFVKNMLKRGEGPGELNGNLTDVIVGDTEVLLYSSNVYKLLRLDLDGKLLGEKKFVTGFSSLLGYQGGRYVVMKRERKDIPRINGIVEDDYRLVLIADNGDIVNTPFVLPLTSAQHYGIIGGRPSGGITSISRFMPLTVDDRFVFLFHSPEYLIRVIDLEKGEVTLSFRRKYERVKYEYALPKNAPANYPVPKYHNDLCRLLWHKGNLWAVTSTVDKNKGILVDVFSREGQYLDNFYLPIFKIRRNNPQYYAPMAIWENFLYLLEADEDDIISLIKYEIVGE